MKILKKYFIKKLEKALEKNLEVLIAKCFPEDLLANPDFQKEAIEIYQILHSSDCDVIDNIIFSFFFDKFNLKIEQTKFFFDTFDYIMQRIRQIENDIDIILENNKNALKPKQIEFNFNIEAIEQEEEDNKQIQPFNLHDILFNHFFKRIPNNMERMSVFYDPQLVNFDYLLFLINSVRSLSLEEKYETIAFLNSADMQDKINKFINIFENELFEEFKLLAKILINIELTDNIDNNEIFH